MHDSPSPPLCHLWFFKSLTISSLVASLGRLFFLSWQRDVETGNFPFDVVNNSGTPAFRVPAKAASDGASHRLVTPEEVGASVLKELKATAEFRLNSRITQVVMSVPVEFTAAQREATERVCFIILTHHHLISLAMNSVMVARCDLKH